MYKAEISISVPANLKSLAPVAMALLLGACASTQTTVQPSKTLSTPAPDKHGISAVASQHISGQLLGSNGRSPVAGATVYVANRNTTSKRMLNNLSLDTAKTTSDCPAPSEPHFAFACTDADGSFKLPIAQVTQIPMPLVISKGETRTELKLNLNDIGTDIGQVTFRQPGDSNEETIAIVLDFFDPYDDISNKLNNTRLDPEAAFLVINDQISEVLDMENPNQHIEFPKFASLFEDNDDDGKADIFNYNSVYINSRDADDIANMDKNLKKHLLRFIATGGELYVTEWTIETPEPSLDQYI